MWGRDILSILPCIFLELVVPRHFSSMSTEFHYLLRFLRSALLIFMNQYRKWTILSWTGAKRGLKSESLHIWKINNLYIFYVFLSIELIVIIASGITKKKLVYRRYGFRAKLHCSKTGTGRNLLYQLWFSSYMTVIGTRGSLCVIAAHGVILYFHWIPFCSIASDLL